MSAKQSEGPKDQPAPARSLSAQTETSAWAVAKKHTSQLIFAIIGLLIMTPIMISSLREYSKVR